MVKAVLRALLRSSRRVERAACAGGALQIRDRVAPIHRAAEELSDKSKQLCSGLPRAGRAGPTGPVLSSLVPPEPRSRGSFYLSDSFLETV
jgi:hypothetical protein